MDSVIRCINCDLTITRAPRHPLTKSDEVRDIIQRWIVPRQVLPTSMVCHQCWAAAENEIRLPTDTKNNLIVIHRKLCAICHKSVMRKRSYLLNENSPHDSNLRNYVARTVAPRELTTPSYLCCGCVRNAKRKASLLINQPTVEAANEQIKRSASTDVVIIDIETVDANVQSCGSTDLEHNTETPDDGANIQSCGLTDLDHNTEIPDDGDVDWRVPKYLQDKNDTTKSKIKSPSPATIFLPNFARAPIKSRQCFFCRSKNSDRVTVPLALRVSIFCNYNYYIPKNSKICSHHLNKSFTSLASLENPIRKFTADQIEDFTELLKSKVHKHLDFENIHCLPEHIVKHHLGISRERFQQMLTEFPVLSNTSRGALGLAAYLMKLRTGDSMSRISALLQVARSSLERPMKMAREALKDFAEEEQEEDF